MRAREKKGGDFAAFAHMYADTSVDFGLDGPRGAYIRERRQRHRAERRRLRSRGTPARLRKVEGQHVAELADGTVYLITSRGWRKIGRQVPEGSR